MYQPKHLKRFKIFVLLSVISIVATAQDTLSVLQYNLLYYGEPTDWCDNTNNNISDKDGYLRTIVGYMQPDIFAVNEISKSPSIHLHLLDQVMNTNGINYYKKAVSLSQDAYNIVNMLYYNSEKLALHSQHIAQQYIRDVDVYKLYHINNGLENGDTTFVICVVAHLKAGSGTDNENKREIMARSTMAYLDALNDEDNYLMMGDFNVYSANEPAYRQFLNYTNPQVRFYDPIDRPGDWNNNFQFRDVHTQSTHADDNGCASYGGMDDRFDFILISDDINDGTKGIKYIPGTYRAVGQDGEHFNKSINASPINTSVPTDVLSALYNNSDHLPVTLKLLVDISQGINDPVQDLGLIVVNPFSAELKVTIHAKQNEDLHVELTDMSGRVLMAEPITVMPGPTSLNLQAPLLQSGLYLLRVKKGNQLLVTKKLIRY